jgi:cell division protein FtsN
MPRDYKGRAEAARTRSTACPTWFVVGLVLGVFLSGLLWLKLSPQGPATRPGEHAAPANAPRGKQESEVPPPRYDFYTLLPAQEVVVPQEEISEPEPETPPASRPEGASSTDAYVLQMGAFRKYADADRLKAGLALLGVQAEIQRVSIDGKESFHRVRSGPYTRRQAYDLHARLKANGVPGLVIKVSN